MELYEVVERKVEVFQVLALNNFKIINKSLNPMSHQE